MKQPLRIFATLFSIIFFLAAAAQAIPTPTSLLEIYGVFLDNNPGPDYNKWDELLTNETLPTTQFNNQNIGEIGFVVRTDQSGFLPALTLTTVQNNTEVISWDWGIMPLQEYEGFYWGQFKPSFKGTNVSEIEKITGTVVHECQWDCTTITRADPVPEPATMLLFGTGIVGLTTIRRKKNS